MGYPSDQDFRDAHAGDGGHCPNCRCGETTDGKPSKSQSRNETKAWAKVEQCSREIHLLRKQLHDERSNLSFFRLRQANVKRNREAFDGSSWTLNDWMTALAGEVGEAANILKKVRRGDFTLSSPTASGKRTIRDDLADELADVQTYLDLLAAKARIDLGRATRVKFNKVSRKVRSEVSL